MPQIFEIATTALNETWNVPKYKSAFAVKAAKQKSNSTFDRLGDIAKIASGVYISEYGPTGWPYLRVDSIRCHVINLTHEDIVFIPEPIAREVNLRCQAQPNDILIARTGTLGKACLVLRRPGHPFLLSQHVTRITIEEGFEPGFVTLFLNSPLGKSQLIDGGSGSTRLELTHSDIAGISVPRIDSDIQKKFDKRLRKNLEAYYAANLAIDKLIEKTNLLLFGKPKDPNQLEFEFENRIFDIQPTDLGDVWNPRNLAPNVRGAISLIENKFSCLKIFEIGDLERGNGTLVEHYEKSGIPFIRVSSMINNYIDPFTDHYASESLYKEFKQDVLDGDILFSIEGKIGSVAMCFENSPVVFKNHIQRLRINREFNKAGGNSLLGWVFLVLCSNLGKALIKRYAVIQTTIPGLASRLEDFLIPMKTRHGHEIPEIESLGGKAFKYARQLAEAATELQELQQEFNKEIENDLKN